MGVQNDARNPHPNSAAAGAPGASGPGRPAYDGDAFIGDDPGHADVMDADSSISDEPPASVRDRLDEVDRLLADDRDAG